MIDLPSTLHYIIVAATLAIPIMGVALGQKHASSTLLQALDEQPAADRDIRFFFFLGAAMLEFSGILSLIMGILFFSTMPTTLPAALVQLGAACAFILPAMLAAFVAARPLEAILTSLARQPLLHTQLMRLLLLTQIMLQTPILFGFIISFIIHTSIDPTLSMAAALKLFASGLVFGLGSIGPLIGLGIFAQQACSAVGLDPKAYDTIFKFTFISQGVIETPVLFVFVVSLILYFLPLSVAWYAPVAYCMSALAMSLTTLGAGISSGRIAGSACKQMHAADTTQNFVAIELSRTSLLGQVFIETNAIYGFIIVFVMLFSLP